MNDNEASSDPLQRLHREKYMSLTTYRRNGEGVATPVWFAVDGDRLVAFTGAQTGKAKRIRTNPKVTIAPCQFRGSITGPVWPGIAKLLPDDDRDHVMKLIRAKYWLTKSMLDAVVAIIRLVRRRPQTHTVYIEIRFDTPR